MKFTSAHRLTLRAILDRTYTPLDVREFVQLCYVLALPLIRSKIARGKLNLSILGLNEADIVYDCLADLFRRDNEGAFVQVSGFFAGHDIDPACSHEDDVFLALRRLVFGRVHQALIRLYSEADPALGRILRNIQLDVEKDRVLEERARFGETYLVPHGEDPMLQYPPCPKETLRLRFLQMVSVRDTVPAMAAKLRQVLLMNDGFQRTIPLVEAALLFKEAYALGTEVPVDDCVVERQVGEMDVLRIVEQVCAWLGSEARPEYVGKGKRSLPDFESYINSLKEILLEEFGGTPSNGLSYFDHLREHMPGLTKSVYARRHRAALEYLARRAKKRMRQELRR